MKPVIKKLFLYGTSTFVVLGLLAVLTVYGLFLYLNPKLPDIDTLKDVRLQVPLRVYTQDKELINEFGQMKRSPMKYEEFPQQLINAVLAAEDDRFFEHPGVDYKGILRAALELVMSGGEKRSGGSTITMQVARNFFLSREKTYLRKMNEIFLALKIEKELSKEDILALYLNKIFLGNRAYGFAAASQVYYGKPLAELSLAQTAMLAGLPKAPSRYNPVADPERATERRNNYVLKRMFDLEYVTENEYMLARGEEDEADLHGQAIEVDAMYIAEMVRSEMLERYGKEALSGGFKVYTTIQKDKQDAANSALQTALLEYDRRHGYRGHLQHIDLDKEVELEDLDYWQQALSEIDSIGNLEAAIVFAIDKDKNEETEQQQTAYAYTQSGRVAYLPWDHVNWARRYIDDNHLGPELKKISDILKVGDVIYVAPGKTEACSWLAQVPKVSGALISINPVDGSIDSLVGGFDFNLSKFNRVTQAKRQPGSSFKPFIYSAAIDKGFTPASIINDAPVVFDAPGLEDTWRPENYTGKIYGETRLRKALIKSRNLVSIRLLRDIGIGYAVRYARQFGFENAKLPRDLSLALGSGTLTPLELATGYSVFANGGYRVTPYLIDYIEGPDGKIIYLTDVAKVCAKCSDELEAKAEAEKEKAEAAAHSEQNTSEPEAQVFEDTPVVPVQQDTLQAFLVAGDEQFTLEDTIQRELEFQEGPVALKPAPRVLSPQTSFFINSMMRDVIRRGTGVRARVIGRNDLAGKTGTTNDQRDAWFSGFNANTVTIAWVGFDNPKPLGNRETGAVAALPMWIHYMRNVLKNKPEIPLVQPPHIVSVRINSKSGQLTTATDPDAIFEYLLEDQIANDDLNNPSNNIDPSTDITRDIF